MSGLQVRVDRDRCMGSGNCEHWAPDVFALDDDGIACVVGDPSAHAERVEVAVDQCPTQALSMSQT